MLIVHDPDEYRGVSARRICPHHRLHPEDAAYPGCRCSVSYGKVRRPAGEVAAIKAARREAGDDAILACAALIRIRRRGRSARG